MDFALKGNPKFGLRGHDVAWLDERAEFSLSPFAIRDSTFASMLISFACLLVRWHRSRSSPHLFFSAFRAGSGGTGARAHRRRRQRHDSPI